jgi:hypothetical protein
MKKIIKVAAVMFTMLIIAVSIGITFTGCTEAERVNHNLNKQANYFDCERRVTVYNARTDKIILYIEGYIDISNNTTNELVVTAKTGNSTYKKNYVYLNEYTLYVVEDIGGTHTDPYHYKVYFDTNLVPDIEVK